jgi:uncharacterized damage-inducible protein DinB
MDIRDIETLYAYNRWAHSRLFAALEKLSDQQFNATIQSSFPSIQETVLHIVAAEWIWLKRWKGIFPRAGATASGTASIMRSALSNGGVEVEPLSKLDGLRNFADSIDQERQEFVRGLNEEVLHAPLHFSDMAGSQYSGPLVQLMQHVVNHGTYHRGQVTTMLRQVGAETASLDMVYFFREEQEKAQAAAK